MTIPEDAPLGTSAAQVDDKGRLKLPAEFRDFVDAFGTRKMFVTSLDSCTVLLYAISLWRHNLKVLENFEDQEAARNVATIANANGAGCEMDDQGRVLLPQGLRRKLGLENQTMFLDCYNGLISALGKDVFEARLQKAEAASPKNLKGLRKKAFIG